MAANDPTLGNLTSIVCRYLAGEELYPTNPLVTDMSQFSVTHTITRGELRKELDADAVHLWDSYYSVIPEGYAEEFLGKNTVDKLEYSEDLDCDNFALYLWASMKILNPSAAFGLVIGTTPTGGCHAWNIYRDEAGIHQVEPQNDDEVEYTMKMILM